MPLVSQTPVPIRGLSLFEPYAGGCEWQYYQIAQARRRLITRIAADCSGIHVSWHPAGTLAVLWISNDTDGLMLWQVDLETKKIKRLPLPPPESIMRFAFDKRGERLAFAVAQNPQEQNSRYEVWRLPPPTASGLLAWELKDSAVANPDNELNFSQFPEFLTLANQDELAAWQSNRLKALHLQQLAAPGVAVRLNRYLPKGLKNSDGNWRILRQPDWRLGLLQWYLLSEVPEPTGLLFFEQDGKLQRLATSYQARDFIEVTSEQNWLLLTDQGSGMRPRLYDMKIGTLLFESQVAHETSFWPPVPSPWD